MSMNDNPYLGVGIYSVPEAARLTGVNARRIRRWLRGYTFSSGQEGRSSTPVWVRQLPIVQDHLALGFRDLMEVRFVNAFRGHGVSWPTLRRAAERAHEIVRGDHPFCTKAFRTDGRSIFAEVIDETGETSLLDVVRNQYAFKKILEPYLYRGIEFDQEGVPARWWPLGRKRRVVLDPMRSFGQPIVSREGVPTSILAQAFEIEQSVEVVADWYEVDPVSVQDAIAFEISAA
jgi:uncharacterized protein (DUF433 family)